MKKILMICVISTIGLSLSACSSTLDGAGKDIQKMGEKIQDTF